MQPAKARERTGAWTEKEDDNDADSIEAGTQTQTVDVVPPSSPNMTPLAGDDGVVAASKDHSSPFLHPFIFAFTKNKKEN